MICFVVEKNPLEYSFYRQCGCRVCLAIKELHARVLLTRQRPERGDELDRRWLKASSGRMTDSALDPLWIKKSVTPKLGLLT